MPAEAPMPAEVDIIIVGAGMAGLELAAQLAAFGVDGVAVLEAGPGTELLHVNSVMSEDAALRAWMAPAANDPYFRAAWRSADGDFYVGASGIRQRLGGRSLQWYGVLLPAEAYALQDPRWPADIVEELTVSWRGGPGLYDLIGRELLPPEDDREPIRRVGGMRLRRTPRAITASESQGRWRAYSPLDHWRDPVTARPTVSPPAAIHTRAPVAAVGIQGRRAVGVHVGAGTSAGARWLAARTVVLAAGTIPSSTLLIDALNAAGTPIDRLGGLNDHIVQGVFARLDAAAARRLALPPGSYWTPAPAARSNLFLDVVSAPEGGVLLDLQMTGEQLPDARNAVHVGPGMPVVHCELSGEDERVIRAQRQVLRDAWSEIGAAAAVRARALRFEDYRTAARRNDYVLTDEFEALPMEEPVTWCNVLGSEDHEAGTMPLGTVLDSWHRCTGVEGLYAIGPGVLPRTGAANPTLTVLALARRLAGHLAGA